jgi:hypothetical protein
MNFKITARLTDVQDSLHQLLQNHLDLRVDIFVAEMEQPRQIANFERVFLEVLVVGFDQRNHGQYQALLSHTQGIARLDQFVGLHDNRLFMRDSVQNERLLSKNDSLY